MKRHKSIMYVISEIISEILVHALLILTNLLFLSTILQHIHINSADESDIDSEHLEDYPYCGVMKEPTVKAKGRVANSKDSLEDYRWVVQLVRKTVQKRGVRQGLFNAYPCTGSVITDR